MLRVTFFQRTMPIHSYGVCEDHARDDHWASRGPGVYGDRPQRVEVRECPPNTTTTCERCHDLETGTVDVPF